MPDKKKEKGGLRRLLELLICMVVIILVLLSVYFYRSAQTSRNTVIESLYATADTYADDLGNQIDTMTNMAIPSCQYLETLAEDEGKFLEEEQKVCEILASTTDACKVLFCSNEGVGIWDNGETCDAGLLPYFDQIFMNYNKHMFRTQLEDGMQVIVSCVPFSQNETKWFAVMFYDLSEFKRIVKSATFDLNAFVALTDIHGDIILHNGSNSKFLVQDNVLGYVENSKDAETVKFQTRMKSKSKANLSANYDGERRVLLAVPVGVSDLYVVVGLNKAYVDRRVNSLNRSTTIILRILLVVVIAFAAAMIYAIVSSRLRTSQKKQELEQKADTDLLTGLNNKLATERKIKEYMQKNPDGTGMMMLLDLDNFKKINDTKGHAFGDEVLRTLGKNLSPLFRASDILGRIGGDEFMVFLKGVSTREDVEKQARKIVQFFRSFQAGDYVKYSATASIGVALYPRDGADFDSLYKATDAALYISKKNGKNQVAFNDEELKDLAEIVNK